MTVPILRASLILAAAASAGCGARTEVSAEAGRTVTYGCGDVEIKATFRAAGVELIQGDNALRLPQVVAASEARYADDVGNELWTTTVLLDRLGLITIESHQKTRDEIIARQQRELLELSTPVVQLWDEVLALPLVGTLDSDRTQIVMETLLQKIVDTGASVAILDITGVPTVDTLVAQHLMKTVAATRLMGADCIISGIRPQIAQTIVHLGVELGDVVTKASLADAVRIALERTGYQVVRASEG